MLDYGDGHPLSEDSSGAVSVERSPNTYTVGCHRPRLNSITGLKVICILGIFGWHLGFLKSPDLGARCVEVFFVASGFLEGYVHYFDYGFTIGEAAGIAKRKLGAFYPLHLVTLCLAVTLSLIQGKIVFGGQFLLTFGFFATLLQAWFPGIASLSYYNGVSWYLSAILFCYALTPLVAYVTQHARESFNSSRHQFAGEALLFGGLLVLRVLLEVAPALYPKVFYGYSLHTSPLIRLLEYAMAFIAGCVFVERADKRAMMKPRFVRSSFLEVSLCVVLIVLVIWSGGGSGSQSILPRWVFVALFLGLVYVLACEKGIVSRMLGTRPFLLFSYIELEFYMFHQLIIRLVGSGYVRTLLPVVNSGVVRAAAALILSIVMSVLWHRLAARVKKDAATTKGY